MTSTQTQITTATNAAPSRFHRNRQSIQVTEADSEAKERFWRWADRSDSTGCWLWLGCKGHNGYGHFTFNYRSERASRFAWQITQGLIPTGLSVLHSCDNPACVNPSHLFLGTQKDNIADMYAKGRANSPKGSKNAKAKLTEAQVVEIRTRYEQGERVADIAPIFGVIERTVHLIVSNRTWRHV